MLDLGRARAAWRRGYRSAARRRYVLRRGRGGAASSLSTRPASVWRLDESSGLIAADAVGPYPGTHGTLVTPGVPGQIVRGAAYTGAFAINGSLTDMGTTAYAFERTEPFSVTAWVRTTVAGNQAIVGRYYFDATSLSGGWRVSLGVAAGGTGTFLLLKNGTQQCFSQRGGSGNVADGAWHHVAVTYDGSSLTTGVAHYQDGAPMGQVTVSDTLASSIVAPPDIHCMLAATSRPSTPGDRLAGELDDVAIFQGQLTPEEVLAIYQAGLAGVSVANV